MYEEAVAEYQRAIDVGGPPHFVSAIGRAYALWGKRREAQRVLTQLKVMSKTSYVPPSDFAEIYAGLGEDERAMDWLEKAFESGYNPGLKMNHKWDSLRAHPRFQALLGRAVTAPPEISRAGCLLNVRRVKYPA